MKSRVFLASLLAGAIGMCGLTAGEQPRPSKSDDLKKATGALNSAATVEAMSWYGDLFTKDKDRERNLRMLAQLKFACHCPHA